MSGGMRDYEGWEEVRAFKTVRKSNAGASPRNRRDACRFKTDLFSHVKQNDDVVEIGIGSAFFLGSWH